MLTIIDYGASNLKSLTNALDAINVPYTISNDRDVIKQADKIILPGVGSANFAMAQLRKLKLIKVIQELTVPVLGICLGMQLLFDWSAEGETECLGIIKGRVIKFDNTKVKVPQIGWNRIKFSIFNFQFSNLLLIDIPNNSLFYFVHSYYCQPDDQTLVIGTTNYSNDFCSMIQQDNFCGVQFHPEKSGTAGLKFLKDFCDL